MTRYSVQPRDRIIVNGDGFLPFAENMSKSINKNISKNLRGKYSQKFLDHAKQSATDALKITSKIIIPETAEATGDLIGNKIANRITKVSRRLPQNNSETMTNKHDKERYMLPEEKQNIIDDLRLI